MEAPPPEALTAAEQFCGPVAVTEVTDRRGSVVWKATGPTGSAAIKTGHGIAEEITAREAAVLDQMPGYTVMSGRFDGGVWFVSPWMTGPSTWDLFEAARHQSGGKPDAVIAAVDLARAVAELHATGWVHSDLQPAHAIHTDLGVRVLDWSWAWSPTFEQSALLRGGIVHLVAPELAATIQAGTQPVKPTTAAEVYALAGTLWTCATGRWPLDYAAAGIDREAAGPDAIRDAIAARSIPLDRATPWRGLYRVLAPVLASAPADRPTAAELADTLETL